jgi:hypothetical protein
VVAATSVAALGRDADVAQELIAELEARGGGDSPDVAQELEAALARELESVQLGTGVTGPARRDRAGDRGGGGGEISHPARHRRHRVGAAPVAAAGGGDSPDVAQELEAALARELEAAGGQPGGSG